MNWQDIITIICAFGMSLCAFGIGFYYGIKIGYKVGLRKEEQINGIQQSNT